ncbi:hypothetical protein [Planomonospora parontospora]|uniref:hypothetical protein n=1 Tax=Planomonospora parontospora TaxID=58119 RepID=UPI0016713AB6|nr:hypothetical protein [Planomonospora parontospora]
MSKDKKYSKGMGPAKEWNGLKDNKPSKETIKSIADLDEESLQAIKRQLRHELTPQIRKEVYLEYTDTERFRLEKRVRADLEKKFKEKIDSLKKEVDSKLLDPAQLLAEFNNHAGKIFDQYITEGVISKQQISTVLRQAVLEALRTRKMHHAVIIRLDRLSLRGASSSQFREHISDWLSEAGLRRIEEIEDMRNFTMQGDETDGKFLQLLQPAYVDSRTGQLVQAGQVKAIINPRHTKGGKIFARPDADESITPTQE